MSAARVAALLALVAALGGCAARGPVDAGDRAAGPSGARPDASLAERLGRASDGAPIALEPGNSLGADRASVGGAYAAASGHRCRRVRLDGRMEPTRIVCRDDAGRWYLPRALGAAAGPASGRSGGPLEDTLVVPLSGSAGQAATSVSGALRRAGSRDPFARPFTSPIIAGETLWDFARRITGSGRDWPAIAEANGIVDTRTIPAGAELAVPHELLPRDL